jgi:hypothetical protein
MRDPNKWNIGVARLTGFLARFPRSPGEDHVFQFHHILKILEEACEQDLSQFRVAPDRINPRLDNITMDSWRTRNAAQSTVEHAYFCSQVRRLIHYVKNTLADG